MADRPVGHPPYDTAGIGGTAGISEVAGFGEERGSGLELTHLSKLTAVRLVLRLGRDQYRHRVAAAVRCTHVGDREQSAARACFRAGVPGAEMAEVTVVLITSGRAIAAPVLKLVRP